MHISLKFTYIHIYIFKFTYIYIYYIVYIFVFVLLYLKRQNKTKSPRRMIGECTQTYVRDTLTYNPSGVWFVFSSTE